MSSRFLAAAWGANLSTTEKLLYAYLCDSADSTGNVPGFHSKHLAHILNRNVKTTNKALRVLEGNGFLARDGEQWEVMRGHPFGGAYPPKPEISELASVVEKTNTPEPEPEPVVEEPTIAEEAATLGITPQVSRLSDFAEAFGIHDISEQLAAAWQKLERAEAKHNRKEKHHQGEERWTIEIESLDDLMPAIIKAVQCFRDREAEGLPNLAADATEFVKKQLWLAPEYQGGIEPVQFSEAELDEMVQKMNRKGGHFATFQRMTSKNPNTGELETETLPIYQNRVLAKWNQYEAAGDYFTE